MSVPEDAATSADLSTVSLSAFAVFIHGHLGEGDCAKVEGEAKFLISPRQYGDRKSFIFKVLCY